MSNEKNISGDDNVVMGSRNVSGSRNVIIDAPNIVLDRPMILGNNAKGGPNDIVIGSNAGSGSDLFLLLSQLKDLEQDNEIHDDIYQLIEALKSPKENNTKIKKLWSKIDKTVTAANAAQIVANVTPHIYALLT